MELRHGRGRENVIIDAIGPETFTYKGLIREIGKSIGVERRIVSVSPELGYLVGLIMGKFLK